MVEEPVTNGEREIQLKSVKGGFPRIGGLVAYGRQ